MAAGEDEAEAVVFDFGFGRLCGGGGGEAGFDGGGEVLPGTAESGAAAENVNGFEAGGGDEPGTRVGGNAGARPGFESGGEGFVHGFFGEIEIAEKADEGGENAAGFGAVEGFDGGGERIGDGRRHRGQISKRGGGRQPERGWGERGWVQGGRINGGFGD